MTNGTAHLAELEETIPVSEHTYTTKSGVALELRQISAIFIRRMQRDTWGKPQPPIVESRVGPKKVIVRETNQDDPEYKAALALWNEEHNERMLIYVMARGIVNEPSAEDIERIRSFFPGETADGLKYAWLLEMMSDEEVGELSQAIMGLSIPTEKGIADAEARFPGDGERANDQGLPATES